MVLRIWSRSFSGICMTSNFTSLSYPIMLYLSSGYACLKSRANASTLSFSFPYTKQAIGNDIGYTRLLDNRRFFTTFAHDWSNNRIVIRQLAVTSGNRSYRSIIINTRTIRSRDGINRNNAVYRRMVATAF